jgi:hypothetical protein
VTRHARESKNRKISQEGNKKAGNVGGEEVTDETGRPLGRASQADRQAGGEAGAKAWGEAGRQTGALRKVATRTGALGAARTSRRSGAAPGDDAQGYGVGQPQGGGRRA